MGIAVATLGDQLPGAERPHPVGKESRVTIGRAHQHATTRLGLSNQRPQQPRRLRGRGRPKSIQQIIDDHELWRLHKRTSKPDQQLLPRREVRPTLVRTIQRPDPLEHPGRSTLSLPTPTERHRPADDPCDPQPLRHARPIQPHKLAVTTAQPRPLTRGHPRHLPATQPHTASFRSLNPSRDLQQRRLTRQPPAHDRHHLASPNLERGTIQQRHPATTTRRTLTHPDHHQHRHSSSRPRWPAAPSRRTSCGWRRLCQRRLGGDPRGRPRTP